MVTRRPRKFRVELEFKNGQAVVFVESLHLEDAHQIGIDTVVKGVKQFDKITTEEVSDGGG